MTESRSDRKIINQTYITLDGVIERPQDWPPSSETPDDTGGTSQAGLLAACDAVLMGRRTYEVFAAVWPTRSGDPYSDRINSMPKYVVSTTLREPAWANTTVIGDDVVERLKELKRQPGRDIIQYGFGRLSHTLLDHGLLDELRLWVHPFLLRRGEAEDLLFREGSVAHFGFVSAEPRPSGDVILTYRKIV